MEGTGKKTATTAMAKFPFVQIEMIVTASGLKVLLMIKVVQCLFL